MNELNNKTLPKSRTGIEGLDEITNGGLHWVTEQLSTRRLRDVKYRGNLNQQPAATNAAQVVAVPALIKELRFPQVVYRGDAQHRAARGGLEPGESRWHRLTRSQYPKRNWRKRTAPSGANSR